MSAISDESTFYKDINTHIYGGGNVSHILNVMINQKTISNYYHADVMGIYGDVAVKLHTERLLKQFDMSAYDDAKLDFRVTKPLARTIPLSVSDVYAE